MFKKTSYIFLILFVSTSLVASDSSEITGSKLQKSYSQSSDILGSKLEEPSASTTTSGDSGSLKVEKSAYRMIVYPYIGGGLSFADYKAWSGRDLGLFFVGDPDLFKDDEYAYPLIWGAGVMVDYLLTGSLALSSGLSYDYSEFRTEYPFNGSYDDSLSFRAEFIFLTIPLGVHYYFENLFFAGGGLYFGILISDDCYVDDVNGGSIGGDDDIGIFLDLGLNFNLTERNSIMIFARYKHGLVSVYEEEGDIITDIQLRTLTLNMAMGIRF